MTFRWTFLLLLAITSIYYFFSKDKETNTLSASLDTPLQSASVAKDSLPPLRRTPQSSSKTKRSRLPQAEQQGPILLSDPCMDKLFSETDPKLFLKRIQSKTRPLVGDWFYDKTVPMQPATQPSAMDFFNRGLAHARLLAGRENNKQSDELAIQLLMEAHQMDPDNSAPLLYAALIEDRLGRSEQARELLSAALQQSKRYSTYFGDVMKVAYQNVDSPTDFMATLWMQQNAPVADIGPLSKYLKAHKAYEFGEQMIQDTLDPQKNLDLVEYSVLEYALGYGLLKAAGKDKDLLPYNEMFAEKNRQDFIYGSGVFEKLEKNCDMTVLDEIVDVVRSHTFK